MLQNLNVINGNETNVVQEIKCVFVSKDKIYIKGHEIQPDKLKSNDVQFAKECVQTWEGCFNQQLD